MFHLVGGRNDFLHYSQFSRPQDEKDEGNDHDGYPHQRAEMDNQKGHTGEKGGEGVHDEYHLLLIEPLRQKAVMKMVLIR